ncbi:serine hydrolase [Nocardioides sp. GXZ039]|uniref:serine hydrolase n=1 Tax=Nocardioides sp. GXZ039 TaxID=3136018 RepID=UPI0030F43E00
MGELVAWWAGGIEPGAPSWWEQDADEPFYAASLMKVPLAIAAERIDLDRSVPVHDDFESAVGGRFTILREDDQDEPTWDALGESLSLRELRRRAIIDSSNIATNLLLEETGIAAVQEVLAAAGCSERTAIGRGIGDLAARDAGLANDVTARDLARILQHLPPGVEEVMRDQQYRAGIPAGLPAGPLVANKTGWMEEFTHDVAIIRPVAGEPFGLVVLTRGLDSHEDAERRIAALAAEAWERRP